MPELAAECLYNANISATQEEEIVEEFLSLLPYLEFDSNNNDIYNSSRIGCKNKAPDSMGLA
jgi:hypothetical protein